MRRLTCIAALSCLLLGGIPGVSSAHPADFDPPRHGRVDKDSPEVRERFRQARSRVLRERAGLSEESAVKAERVLDSFDEQRIQLRKRLKENRKALKELVRSDSNDQKAYQSALSALSTAQEAMAELRSQEMAALGKVLTPKEQAQVMLAMNEMRRRMKHMLRERRGGFPPDGMPPHGPARGRDGFPPGGDGDPDDPMDE